MNVDTLNKAIAAHGQWKIRLREAMEGRGMVPDPATASRDNACEFGQWLASAAVAPGQATRLGQVRLWHGEFHRAAGEVSRLIGAQRRADAEASLSVGGNYFEASANLVSSLMAWKKELA